MNEYGSYILTPDQVVAMWDDIRPMLQESILANEVSEDTMTPEHILGMIVSEMAACIGFFENGNLKLVLAFQFESDNGNKSVNILAFAGEEMMAFKRLYWDYILNWFRANGVSRVETLANPRMAKVFRRFGFDRSSVCISLSLKE